jgi:hypothetical protein
MPPYGRQAINIPAVASHHSSEKHMYFLWGNKHRTFTINKKVWGLIDSNKNSWFFCRAQYIFSIYI